MVLRQPVSYFICLSCSLPPLSYHFHLQEHFDVLQSWGYMSAFKASACFSKAALVTQRPDHFIGLHFIVLELVVFFILSKTVFFAVLLVIYKDRSMYRAFRQARWKSFPSDLTQTVNRCNINNWSISVNRKQKMNRAKCRVVLRKLNKKLRIWDRGVREAEVGPAGPEGPNSCRTIQHLPNSHREMPFLLGLKIFT